MNVSDKGIDLIKKWESFRSNPYFDTGNVPTIGYGSTFYLDGTRVTMSDKPITEKQASDLLYEVVKIFVDAVNDAVKVDISQNQFDALVSFVYNIGGSQFKRSTLLKKVNVDPCDPSIFDEFLRWKYDNGRVIQGLLNRRYDEAELYFS